jgi:serine/threonine protein kinase
MKSLPIQYLSTKANKDKLHNEIEILRMLKHGNVIRLYETFKAKNLLIIVLELCSGGDLLDYIKKRKTIAEPVAKVAFKQILKAVGYCHSKGIAHRDIKLENILINEEGDIKLCDFGVSKRFAKGELLNERCGTPVYIPPEMFLETPYDGTLSDVWSLGIALYVMLYGSFPFQGDDINVLKEKVISERVPLRNTISNTARRLITRMLSKDPSSRPSIKEILMDAWMQGVDDSGSRWCND